MSFRSRLLAASLKYRETPKWVPDHVRAVAAQCNKMKYNAKRASELSNELYTLKYIEMNSPLITEAAVVEVREKYIDVIIIAMGLNRRIFFNSVCMALLILSYLYNSDFYITHAPFLSCRIFLGNSIVLKTKVVQNYLKWS